MPNVILVPRCYCGHQKRNHHISSQSIPNMPCIYSRPFHNYVLSSSGDITCRCKGYISSCEDWITELLVRLNRFKYE